MQKWNHGQNIIFVRNPNYNSAPANALHQGPAYVEKLVWSFVGNPTTRYGSLTTGESNVIYDVPRSDWATANGIRSGAVHHPGPSRHAQPEHDQRRLHRPKVREAFAYGADRKAAVASAFDGETPYNGNGALSQTTPDYDRTSKTPGRMTRKSQQLLDQAGWKKNADGVREKDGKQLDILLIYPASSMITTRAQRCCRTCSSSGRRSAST